MQDLKGKIALVTGGGRGLGEAICLSLGQAGMFVVVSDINRDLAQKVSSGLNDSNCHATSLELDVSDERQAKEAIHQTITEYGRIDALINNAGTDLTTSIEEMPVSEWDRIINTNLRGPFLLSKNALPEMKKQGSGQIVNVVSTAAKRAWANASAYHASKWGLLGFSHALHVEARPLNIKVTSVVCGGMKTPFLLDRFPDIDQDTLQDPANVANAIRFVLTQPEGTVIPEIMVLPMRETSWP